MGRLLNTDIKQDIYLKVQHVLGRDIAVADTLLSNPTCSRLQCVLSYQGGRWLINDKSKNGTLINGQPLKVNNYALKVDDAISFPGEDTDWILIDSSAPKPMLFHKSQNLYLELTSINLLPDVDNPELLITYQDDHWIIEQGKVVRSISGGEIVKLNGEEWHFYPNDFVQETITLIYSEKDKPALSLYFDISLNEENIRLSINYNDKEFDLGYKTHHQALLLLARYRLSAYENNIPLCEQGWLATDLLLIELRIEPNYLNILIFRLRKAFDEIGYSGALIERRQGEIRLCDCDFTLHKGNEYLNYSL